MRTIRSASLSLEQAFHGCCGHGLMACHVASVQITRREDLQDREDHTRDYTYAQENTSVLSKGPLQQVVRAHCGHHKCAGDHSAAHVVRILQERPWIQEQR